jgi:iron complex transport system permease protein
VTAVSEARTGYLRLAHRRALLLAGLALALVVSCAVDVASGPAGLGLRDVVGTILSPAGAEPAMRLIVWEIRLPVALMAVVVGALLATAGAQMQTVLGNPLASPFTLGISAAASFGAALAIVGGVSLVPFAGPMLVTANAFLCALVAAGIIYALSRVRGASAETVVLLGIGLVFTFNALLALLQFLASEQALQEVVFWTLGSLGKASWTKIGIAAGVLAAMAPWLARRAWMLTALRLGDSRARALGIDVDRLRLTSLLSVSLLAAVAVAFVGTIGFVGLVGPHLARMLLGEDQRFFLAGSALAGALLLSITSIVSKSLMPGVVIPIGIVTALVGVPFFLALVLGRRREFFG